LTLADQTGQMQSRNMTVTANNWQNSGTVQV